MGTNIKIDRTNRFYIEMSRKLLSEKEYDILQKLLLEKMTLQQAGDIYGVTGESIRRLYDRIYSKVKSVTEVLAEIDSYKLKLEELKCEFRRETGKAKRKREKPETELQKLLYASHFPFSRRMHNLFESLDIRTMGELAAIPLKDFTHFRGFKAQGKKELIAFIEFENIEHLFKGFSVWKKAPIK